MTPEATLRHLLDHRKAGHKVPKYAIQRIKKRLKERYLKEMEEKENSG
jgi:hypothetical protein